ncbi:MAG: dienelactone hydrolase family protein, partial [Pseudomonadota bacterium]
MGETTTLTASDGHTLGAYISRPDGPAKGGIVVVQEIFGVNEHIRDVTDQYAGLGYAAIAPAFFDRIERDIQLGYDEPGFARGRELIGEIGFEEPLLDLAAGAAAVADAGDVSTVGYCWGGAIVWLAASEIEGLSHAISYYGSRIAQFQDRAPKIPTMMHVGREDA